MSDDLPPEVRGHWRGAERCVVCEGAWDVNMTKQIILLCCCEPVCAPCSETLGRTEAPCPLCRAPFPPSADAALAIVRRNAERRNPAALSYLGSCYADGKYGLARSNSEAARLYRSAADLGDAMGMYNLAVAYRDGRGVERDAKRSIEYFRRVADRGHANAQNKLGISFASGPPKDYNEAIRYFRLAADQGYAEAIENMGYLIGVIYENAHEKVDAIRWYERSAAKGNARSVAALARLRRR